MIFDEPSSALDPISEREFWNNIMDNDKNNLFILTTHRMMGIRNADYYLVLKEGLLVEEGKLNELLEKRGELFRFYQAQE